MLAQSHDLAQWLLACISLFCEQCGLTVSLTKMEWVLGGWVPRDYVVGD